MLFLFILMGCCCVQQTTAQTKEFLLKAGFIEKFTHFVTWPSEKFDSDSIFHLSVFGKHPYGNSLNEIFKKVKINNRPVRIHYIQSIEEIGNSAILILPPSSSASLKKILKAIHGKDILTIGDTEGFGNRGVMINMFLKGSFIRYEINQRSLQSTNLKMSSLLLSAAESILK